MFSLAFLEDAAERAIRTFAQGVLGAIGAGTVSIIDVDWAQAAGIGGLAAVVSLLMSIVATGVGNRGDASFLGEK